MRLGIVLSRPYRTGSRTAGKGTEKWDMAQFTGHLRKPNADGP
ncbi:hypothetical protein OKW26_000488 [Paraburkholderia sp. 32]